MIDATKSDEQRAMLVAELEEVGIRLNTQSPDVVFKQKTAGGITVSLPLESKLLTVDHLHCQAHQDG
jgi:ribosome-interacting GTPase 1